MVNEHLDVESHWCEAPPSFQRATQQRYRGHEGADRGNRRARKHSKRGVGEGAEEGGEKEVEEGQLRMKRRRKHVGLDITL